MRRRDHIWLIAILIAGGQFAAFAWAANIDCSGGGLACEGTTGPDTITGSNNDDDIDAKGGADTVNARKGNDGILGRGGDDRLFGGPGDERPLVGSIIGGPGDDRLYGEAGSDYVQGEAGDDRMFGGKGGDSLYAATNESPSGRDLVNCGQGTDQAAVNLNDEVRDNCETVSLEPNPRRGR